MATQRQKKAIAYAINDNMPVSRAMLKAGYSPTMAKNPQELTRSKAWLEIVEKNGISLDNVSQIHNKLLHSKREEIQQRAVDTAYKVHGVYDRTRSTQSTTPIQIVINPPQQVSTRQIDGVEVVRQTGGEDSTPIAP
jgi:hypothetical protein